MAWLEADWPAPPTVRCISTLRAGGVSKTCYASLNLGRHVGDEPACVDENRRRLRAMLRLPGEPVWLAQVHGIEVADLGARWPAAPAADAAVARGRDVCAILTADCLPVMLTDDEGSVVAAAHAGWRGLSAGVVEAAVRAMALAPAHLMAWLGPAIGADAFEVGSEVREAFLSQDPAAAGCFTPNARGRFLADLAALAQRRLQAAGVTRVYGGGLCTHADPARFFSHRRDGSTGRQATLIWREPKLNFGSSRPISQPFKMFSDEG